MEVGEMAEDPKDIDVIPEGAVTGTSPPAAPAPAVRAERPAVESCAEPPEVHREVRPVTRERRQNLSRRTQRILIAAGAVLVLVLAAFFTMGVTFADSPGAAAYPYTTTYDVIFPNSEKVQLGNVEILAIPSAESVTLSVNKQREDIALNEVKEISARRAIIAVLGIPVLKFDFKVLAEYRGMVGTDARFYLSVKTSDQMPEFIVGRLLPSNIQARPA